LPGSAHGVLVEVARPYKAVERKWEAGDPMPEVPA
jgi:hypothetical protein